jgi:lipopolysaccharide export system protein LptC
MSYRVLALLALLTLTIGIVLLSAPQRESGAPAAPGGPLHDPGYSALQARLIQTGVDGRPLYTLDAAQIQQQPNQGTVQMQKVKLGFRDASGHEWTANAAHGELAQNSGVIRLDGDVHIFGILPGTDDPAQIISEHFAYDTNTQVVATRDPVTLVMSGRELNAIGLIASLKDRRLQLESAVHGTFSQ